MAKALSTPSWDERARETMEDLLEFVIELAKARGAAYAEARYQSDEAESNLLKNGVPEVSSFESRKGISVRLVIEGGLGFGATNQMNRRSLRAMVKSAAAAAKASSKLRIKPIAMSQADMYRGKEQIRPRVNFDAVDLEGRIALLSEIDSASVSAAEEAGAKLAGRYVSLDTLLTEKRILNTDGVKAESITPRVSMDMFLTAFDPEKGTAQRMLNLGESGGWENVERWDPVRLVAAESKALVKVLMKAEAVKEETSDVVLGPEVVGIISHESSGHPSEADRILGREAAQAGETYLGRDTLGLKVGSDVVNVVDDPTLSRSYGHYLFDDEGVRARKRYLIKEGRIAEFLHNRETAAEFGVKSNAASRSVAYNREPIVRMANTFVEPGDLEFEELLEGVRFGVYLRNFMEWNIDDRRYNQRYVGLEAYRIEDGQLRGMIRNPILEITTPALWSAVDAVGDKLEFSAATCGKGDPMQGVPVWTGGPHIRLRNVRMGGSA